MKLLFKLLLILILFNGCDDAKKKIVLGHRNEFVGHYKINLKKSRLNGYQRELSSYENLTLALQSDSSFRFYPNVPFIFKNEGKWEMGGDGESVYEILNYLSGISDQTLMDTTNAVFIKMPVPKDGMKQVSLLYFDRQNN